MSEYLDSTASMCAGSVSSTRFDSRGLTFSSCCCVDDVDIAPATGTVSLGLVVGFALCEEGMAQAATMNGSRDVVQTICRQMIARYYMEYVSERAQFRTPVQRRSGLDRVPCSLPSRLPVLCSVYGVRAAKIAWHLPTSGELRAGLCRTRRKQK